MAHELKALLDRVEAATGANYALECDIFRALAMPLPEEYANIRIGLKWDEAQQAFIYPLGDMQVRYNPPPCSASVDAAIVLCAATLPHAHWSVTNACASTERGGKANVWVPSPISRGVVLNGPTKAATPALALVAALLRALIAKETS